MLTDGQLLRLDRESFIDLIRNQLIEEIDVPAAESLIQKGAVWLDVRATSEFEKSALPGAINIPLAMLRIESRKYAAENIYVVCSDNPRTSAAGAFILMQRGFDTRSLGTPVGELLAGASANRSNTTAEPSAQPPAEQAPLETDEDAQRISPDEFADTITGKTLAQLIDEIYVAREDAVASGVLPSAAMQSPDDASYLEEALEGSEPLAAQVNDLPEENLPTQTRDTTSDDPISTFIKVLDASLRKLVSNADLTPQSVLVDAANAKLAKVRRAAAMEIRKRINADREAFDQAMKPRRERLEQRYDQLIAFANRLAKRKADIQKARKVLQDNLEATERLRRELGDISRVLIQRIENLDKIENDLAA